MSNWHLVHQLNLEKKVPEQFYYYFLRLTCVHIWDDVGIVNHWLCRWPSGSGFRSSCPLLPLCFVQPGCVETTGRFSSHLQHIISMTWCPYYYFHNVWMAEQEKDACMSMCVSECVCVWDSVCVCEHVVWTYVCVCMCVRAYVCACVCVWVCACMCEWASVCGWVCMCNHYHKHTLQCPLLQKLSLLLTM